MAAVGTAGSISMTFIYYAAREINCKIVYYGPGLCGKTTNLQYIHDRTNPAARGKMISLATEADRTLFFDFLPVELGTIRGMRTRMQIYTVPGQVFYEATRRMVLKGCDAVVFVADSQAAMLDANFESRIETVFSNAESIERHIQDADLVVGGVLIPGAAAPKLVSREQLSHMRPGSVLVDVAIDQGGCFETSRPTTHAEPTYIIDDIVHYCVANMPGAVPRTSTFALNNVTLPFTLQLADKGAKQAMLDNPHLLEGLNVHRGKVTYDDVARDLGYDYMPALEALEL